jgi:heptosyltransferase-2
LLKGLKKAFPDSKVSIGVGDWAMPLLENNPDVDEIIPCNAPWHNKQNCRYSANSLKTFMEGLLYVLFSRESKYISSKKFTHGIDILGSRQGSWLLRSAGIPNRFGVKGYAGGDNWCKKSVSFKENRKVAEAALEFLKLLGSNEKIESRPKIYLTENEVKEAQRRWNGYDSKKKKIIIAPGGGFPEKCWGDKNFNLLTNLLLSMEILDLTIIGSREDRSRIRVQESEQLKNWCGRLSLRESAGMVSQSDFVITNTSLCMHLAGAFEVPSLTLLGDWYDSAKLHHEQWGYPEGKVLGKEKTSGIIRTIQPIEVLQIVKNSLKLR